MSVRRPALLLPYGLKSWLYAVTRAVVHQKPRDVAEFIATYCQKLYDIHDLTRLFREVEGNLNSVCSGLKQ
uniref:RIIa domain-containing protein n=1 Tax=Pygocentrus nattereri TaxID=42514 RepID=A0A3B4CHT2_PYGNA